MSKLTQDNMQEFICDIVEMFEDFLEEKGITIENPEKQEAINTGEDPESICNIYGTDYGWLQSECEELIEYWNLSPIKQKFMTFIVDDDINVLMTGKMYDGINKERFETRRSLAILEMGYMDIELNICKTDAEGKELEAAYYICKKCGENKGDWEGVGYADEVLPLSECAPNIDWSGDYTYQLHKDMERVLKLYVEKTGLYFDKPNEP